jgi:hypothetical protein
LNAQVSVEFASSVVPNRIALDAQSFDTRLSVLNEERFNPAAFIVANIFIRLAPPGIGNEKLTRRNFR